MKVGSFHGLGRLVWGIHRVLDLRLTDCLNRFVQSEMNLDGGDHRLAGCQERGGLVCQRLVACDAAKRERLAESLGKKKEYQTYIAIATETAKCNISTLPTESRRRSSATCGWLRNRYRRVCWISSPRVRNWDWRRSRRLSWLRRAVRNSWGVCDGAELDISLRSANWATVHATRTIRTDRDRALAAVLITINCRAAMGDRRCRNYRYSWRNRGLAVHRRDRA